MRMPLALASPKAPGAYPQSSPVMIASAPKLTASRISVGARLGSYCRSKMLTVQPSALAASAAALTGMAALGFCWLGERIASFLPLAAMRMPSSGGWYVPLYIAASVAPASASTSPGDALPGTADPDGSPWSPLHAAVPATRPIPTMSATKRRKPPNLNGFPSQKQASHARRRALQRVPADGEQRVAHRRAGPRVERDQRRVTVRGHGPAHVLDRVLEPAVEQVDGHHERNSGLLEVVDGRVAV